MIFHVCGSTLELLLLGGYYGYLQAMSSPFFELCLLRSAHISAGARQDHMFSCFYFFHASCLYVAGISLIYKNWQQRCTISATV